MSIISVKSVAEFKRLAKLGGGVSVEYSRIGHFRVTYFTVVHTNAFATAGWRLFSTITEEGIDHRGEFVPASWCYLDQKGQEDRPKIVGGSLVVGGMRYTLLEETVTQADVEAQAQAWLGTV